MSSESQNLQELISRVRSSRRHRSVCTEVVAHVGAQELASSRGLKAAIKATKSKLHQIGGAYFTQEPRYERWLDGLTHTVHAEGTAGLRGECLRIMGYHSSTRERRPVIEEFYAETLADVAPVHSVMDVACGLNPLSIPWMPLAPNAAYYAYDMYTDLMAFLRGCLQLFDVRGEAAACDVAHSLPRRPVEVAYLLKTIPCLEQFDRSAGERLLDEIPARHLLVSFPVQSLGGRNKGMPVHYEARFRALVQDKPWAVRRFRFESELAFLVTKEATVGGQRNEGARPASGHERANSATTKV